MKSRFVLVALISVIALQNSLAKRDFPGSQLAQMNLAEIRTRYRSAGIPKAGEQEVVKAYGQLPIRFEINQGQTDSRVDFVSRGNGYTVFLMPTKTVLAFRKPARNEVLRQKDKAEMNEPTTGRSVLELELVGANPNANVAGLEELPGRSNYFIGNDPKRWRTNAPNYGKVRYQNVYPGVDVIYYGNKRQLEHDFIVAPGTDPNTIRFQVKGADEMEINREGDLVLRVSREEVRLKKPLAYQDLGGGRREVAAAYVLKDADEVKFEVAAYDRTNVLVVDPILVYSTFLGGSGNDVGDSIAVDSFGNAYVSGVTESVNFPTMSPLQPTLAGTSDVFVAKLNAAGSGLLYSTYIGGTCFDVGVGERGLGIAIDGANNAYVTGHTPCADFPTMNPIQPTYGGGNRDAFVLKLNAAGSLLEYSTYLGGSGSDQGFGIAVNAAGDAYVTGFTNSNNFPTANPLQASFAGGPSFGDAFVAKLNPMGTALVYSTYLGGSGDDAGLGISLDTSGNAYISGHTASSNFPTVNPIQPIFGGGVEDGFVAKLNTAGSALVYSTYLGGNSRDRGGLIAVDSAGNAYMTGFTGSNDFPITSGAFQTTFAGGFCSICIGGIFGDAFVTKLNPVGGLVYSTYFGAGSGFEQGTGIAVDSAGNVYVAGFTNSTDLPTVDPIQASFRGGTFDGFVAKFNATGSALLFSTYLGGSAIDQANDIVLLPGSAYIAGVTSSSDFPTTSQALQTAHGGGLDAFVARIVGGIVPTGLRAIVGNQRVYLTWDPSPEPIDGYNIQVARFDGTAFISLGNVNPQGVLIQQSSFRVFGFANGELVENGELYRFTVTAVRDGAESQPSNSVFARPNEFAAPVRSTSPVLFLHGINATSSTYDTTKDFLVYTLGWNFGGTLSYLPGDDPRTTFPFVRNFNVGADFYTADFGNNLANYTDGRRGLFHQADEVGGFIRRIRAGGNDRKIAIVAHSMGGLSARAYIHENPTEASGSVADLVTYGTPHRGLDFPALQQGLQDMSRLAGPFFRTIVYYLGAILLNGPGGMDMDGGCGGTPSLFMQQLNSNGGNLSADIRYTSIVGHKDLIFYPHHPASGDCLADTDGLVHTDFVVPTASADLSAIATIPVGVLRTDKSHLDQTSDFPSILCALFSSCMQLRVLSPIDIEVTAPDGTKMARDFAGIPGASYMNIEESGGHETAMVIVPFPLPGEYIIKAIPKPGASPTDTFTIMVSQNGMETVVAQDLPMQDAPADGFRVQVNAAPVANAGPDKHIECAGHSGTTITLNGAGSTDADGDPLSYEWRDGQGSLVGTGAQVSLALPLGTHSFNLTVADGNGGVATDNLLIRIVDTTPPKLEVSLEPARREGGHEDESDGESDNDVGEGGHLYRVIAQTSDTCDPGVMLTASINGIAVEHGQIVRLKLAKKPKQSTKGGMLRIRAPEIVLTATAKDGSGNSTVSSFALQRKRPRSD